MKADGVPIAIKVILKEAIVNPDFALKVFTTIYGKDTPQKVEHTGKDGTPLIPQPITIEIIDSAGQVDTEALANISPVM